MDPRINMIKNNSSNEPIEVDNKHTIISELMMSILF